MNGLRKRKKLKGSQLFPFTYAAHTSSLILFTYVKPVNSRSYARKIYVTVEINLYGKQLGSRRSRKKLKWTIALSVLHFSLLVIFLRETKKVLTSSRGQV